MPPTSSSRPPPGVPANSPNPPGRITWPGVLRQRTAIWHSASTIMAATASRHTPSQPGAPILATDVPLSREPGPVSPSLARAAAVRLAPPAIPAYSTNSLSAAQPARAHSVAGDIHWLLIRSPALPTT